MAFSRIKISLSCAFVKQNVSLFAGNFFWLNSSQNEPKKSLAFKEKVSFILTPFGRRRLRCALMRRPRQLCFLSNIRSYREMTRRPLACLSAQEEVIPEFPSQDLKVVPGLDAERDGKQDMRLH